MRSSRRARLNFPCRMAEEFPSLNKSACKRWRFFFFFTPASSTRLSAAVALSSPRADTQILSRNSLARCLMVHQYQVQWDAGASVCAHSSQLLSTVTRPSVTKCRAVTPVLEHYPPSTSMIFNEPTRFLLSINNWTATEGAIFSSSLSSSLPQLFEGSFPSEFKMHVGKTFARLNAAAAEGDAEASVYHHSVFPWDFFLFFLGHLYWV